MCWLGFGLKPWLWPGFSWPWLHFSQARAKPLGLGLASAWPGSSHGLGLNLAWLWLWLGLGSSHGLHIKMWKIVNNLLLLLAIHSLELLFNLNLILMHLLIFLIDSLQYKIILFYLLNCCSRSELCHWTLSLGLIEYKMKLMKFNSLWRKTYPQKFLLRLTQKISPKPWLRPWPMALKISSQGHRPR